MRRVLLPLLLVACSRGAPAPSPPAPSARPLDAAAAPTPPVDPLPHDAESLADAARHRFGQNVHLETVDDPFVLVDLPAHGPLFGRARALLGRAVPAFYDGELSRRPERAVTVLLFSTAASYRDYARDHRAESGLPYGMYLPSPREIAVDLSLGPESFKTLTHEAMHVLLEGDFPGAPAWLREGLASLFEEPVFAADGSIHGAPRNWPHPLLQEALASPSERDLVHLDAVFDLTEARFRSGGERAVALHYALARAVCAWLDSTGQLWPFYRAWRDTWHDDESGRAAFARVTGFDLQADLFGHLYVFAHGGTLAEVEARTGTVLGVTGFSRGGWNEAVMTYQGEVFVFVGGNVARWDFASQRTEVLGRVSGGVEPVGASAVSCVESR